MKNASIATMFLAISLAGAVPALAADDESSCRDLAKRVSAALAQASGDVSEAQRERRMGIESCTAGYWQNGVVHYRKALSLLGK